MAGGSIVQDYPFSTQDAITAFAGGGQANAVEIIKHNARISTCATAGDSVKLPSAFSAGYIVYIQNDGAKRADIFPASGDTINDLAANTAIQILPGQRIGFMPSAASSAWRTL